jgi:hypothetical protein
MSKTKFTGVRSVSKEKTRRVAERRRKRRRSGQVAIHKGASDIISNGSNASRYPRSFIKPYNKQKEGTYSVKNVSC